MIIDIFKDKVIPLLNEGRELKAHFVWGDSSYIRETLLTLKKSSATAPFRYPLIGLYAPIDETVKTDGGMDASVNVIIAVNTLPEYTNEQRLEISFKGVLRPLYEDFLNAVRGCKRFYIPYEGIIPHTYVENYSFGRRGALDVDGKEMDEKIDAIEIKNLELNFIKQTCYANRL